MTLTHGSTGISMEKIQMEFTPDMIAVPRTELERGEDPKGKSAKIWDKLSELSYCFNTRRICL